MLKLDLGTARRVITPRVPASLAGYFNVRMWDRVLDDLEVRAVVFRQNGCCGAILQYDLVNVPQNVCRVILDAVHRAGLTEFTRENVMLCATHCHTGPEVRPGRRGLNPEYLPFLAARSAEALKEAAEKTESVEVLHATASDARFLFNRRYWMRSGNVMTNPGKGNPQILRPEGEIDPEIPLLGFRRGDGSWKLLISSIVNHSDTIGGNGVSADWPGFLHRMLEPELGPGSMVLPLVGAAGNINHFDVSNPAGQSSYAEAERIGSGYAETVRNALGELAPLPEGAFRVLSGEAVSMPREISAAEAAEARAVMEKYAAEDIDAGKDMTSEDLAKGVPAVLKYFASVLLRQAENREEQRFQLNGFVFGSGAVIASLPAEPFVEIGLTLRKEIFAGRTCLVTEQANGTGSDSCGGGYIPNPWNYGRGGYETTPRSNPYSVKTASLLLARWRGIVREDEDKNCR